MDHQVLKDCEDLREMLDHEDQMDHLACQERREKMAHQAQMDHLELQEHL